MRKNGEQMISGYNKLLSIFSVCTIVIFIGCNKDTKTQESNSVEKVSAVAENVDPDCVEYVALWAAGDIAERIGKDKKWVFLNYNVEMWDTPPTYGQGNIVGQLRASSYARIIEKKGNDYKVESPINQINGWISNEHVKTISWKNQTTRKLCK